MTESVFLVGYVRVTASGAGVGGIAAVYAIWLSYYCIVAMTERRDNFYAYVIAIMTGIGYEALICAIGLVYCFAVVVTEGAFLFSSIRIAALRTGIGRITVSLTSGRGNARYQSVGVRRLLPFLFFLVIFRVSGR